MSELTHYDWMGHGMSPTVRGKWVMADAAEARIKELEAKLAASRIRQNRIPDRAVKQIKAADALADAVDGYLESTGCEDDSSVVDAALTAYREAGK